MDSKSELAGSTFFGGNEKFDFFEGFLSHRRYSLNPRFYFFPTVFSQKRRKFFLHQKFSTTINKSTLFFFFFWGGGGGRCFLYPFQKDSLSFFVFLRGMKTSTIILDVHSFRSCFHFFYLTSNFFR